jgi:hypothetical protein
MDCRSSRGRRCGGPAVHPCHAGSIERQASPCLLQQRIAIGRFSECSQSGVQFPCLPLVVWTHDLTQHPGRRWPIATKCSTSRADATIVGMSAAGRNSRAMLLAMYQGSSVATNPSTGRPVGMWSNAGALACSAREVRLILDPAPVQRAATARPEPQLGPVRQPVPGPGPQLPVQPPGRLMPDPHGPLPAALAPDPDLPRLQVHVTTPRVTGADADRASSATRMPVARKTARTAASRRSSKEFPRQHRPSFERRRVTRGSGAGRR